jgi:hypothetical protein
MFSGKPAVTPKTVRTAHYNNLFRKLPTAEAIRGYRMAFELTFMGLLQQVNPTLDLDEFVGAAQAQKLHLGLVVVHARREFFIAGL